jgi:hypothetical protein
VKCTHLVLDSSSLSIVFCRRSSSMRVTVTSFSLSLDSVVEMGGVTPRYLSQTAAHGLIPVGKWSNVPLRAIHSRCSL